MDQQPFINDTIKKQSEFITDLEKRLRDALGASGQITKNKTDIKISWETLREIITYNPQDGLFRWNDLRPVEIGEPGGTSGKRMPGRVAGSRIAGSKTGDSAGRVMIMVENVSYAAHLLAWFWMTGAYPSRRVIHLDGDKQNNRWSNLKMIAPKRNIRTPLSDGTKSLTLTEQINAGLI